MKSTPPRFTRRVALGLAALSLTCAPPYGLAPASRARQAATPQTPGAPRLVAALEGYEGPSVISGRRVLAVFSPDGRTLALSGAKRTIRLHDAETGSLLLTLAGEKENEGFNGFAFSPDS